MEGCRVGSERCRRRLLPPLLGHGVQLILSPLSTERRYGHHLHRPLVRILFHSWWKGRWDLLIAFTEYKPSTDYDKLSYTSVRFDRDQMHGCSGVRHC